MVRYLGYALTLMRSSNRVNMKETKIVYYLDVVEENQKSLDECKSIGVIVPFLHKDTLASLQKKITSLVERRSGVKIFVVSIFADLETIANLCRWKKNIYLVNIIYIVNVKALLTSLEENCEIKNYDYKSDKALVQLMLDTSHTELIKEDVVDK